MNLDELYSEILIDLANSKRHRGEPTEKAISVRGVNPNCGDDIVISAQIEGGKIKRIWRSGKACAIAEASAEILAKDLEGKNLDDAKETVGLFLKMVRGESLNESELGRLGDARLLSGISKFPARVKCAGLAWYTLNKIISTKKDRE